jgi:hypothetical protein
MMIGYSTYVHMYQPWSLPSSATVCACGNLVPNPGAEPQLAAEKLSDTMLWEIFSSQAIKILN